MMCCNPPPGSGRFWIAAWITVIVAVSAVGYSGAADMKVPLPTPRPNKAFNERYTDPRCATGERYDVMREAYEARLPNPCSSPRDTEWRR